MRGRSISKASQRLGKVYKVHEFLSDSFTINWLFIIDTGLLNKYEEEAIKNIYSKSLPILRTSVISFNPLGSSLQIFKDKFDRIKGQGKMIKVVSDIQNAHAILVNLQQQNQLDMISQFYVYSPISEYDPLRLQLKQQYPRIILKETIGDVVNIASEQINKWRLKFQILKNLMPLNKTSREKAYEYRIRLNTCIRLSPNLFDRYADLFDQYIGQEIESRKLWDQTYQKRACSKRKQIITDLRKAAQIFKEIDFDSKKVNQILQKLKQLEQIQIIEEKGKKQDKQKAQKDKKIIQELNYQITSLQEKIKNRQKQFIEVMLRLYKKETIFYELLNNGIKYFEKKQFNWEHLSLPICLLFKIIKLAYKDQSNNINNQSFQQFTLWRGGKISQNQCLQISNDWTQYPFYEFLSFVSTSKDINVALSFLKSTEREVKKMNCLFKFIVKKPTSNIHQMHYQFFRHGYCRVPNQYGKNAEQQFLLNIFSVGKIIDFELMSFKRLKQQYKINKNLLQQDQIYNKIPVITVQIGNFEELFAQETYSNIRQRRKKQEQKKKHKQLIESFMYTIDIIRKYQSFDFANAYQLCNQMEKSYHYLLDQINRRVESKSSDQDSKLQFLYSQEDYYSRLSDICRKMGRLSQALIFNESAIEKCKQMQNIDKNRSFHYYQEKLNTFYLKSSQLLIQKHQYCDATKIINQRIEQLQDNKDQKEKERNKVIISRLLLDLGVANFKQGKIDKAKQIFTQSAKKVQEIFIFINYDLLNKETFLFDWIKGVLFEDDVKLFDGPQVFYERQRKKKIKKQTEIYGGQERLHIIKKNANSLAFQTTQVIQNHREFFSNNQQYESIINEVKSKIDTKIKNQQQIPQQIFMKNNEEKLTQNQMVELAKKVNLKKIENQYQKMKKQMNDCLIFEQKDNFKQIKQQQKLILQHKKKLQNLKLQFWSNPTVYLYDNFEFKKQFDDLWLKKQQINRQKLLKSNDQVTMEELVDYYKKNAESLSKYIEQQQKWGYSQSAPKVLQQYNRLIKLYIQINCKNDAFSKIEQVKRLANIKGQQKYYQLAVAYFLKGKIYQDASEIDFLTFFQSSSKQKLKYIQETRRKNAQAALAEFSQSYINFRKALVKEENGKQNIDAFLAQPQQLQLKIWKAKSQLTLFDLTEKLQEKPGLLQNLNSLLGEISMGLKHINNSNSQQLKSDYFQTLAIYHFRSKQYFKCLECFDQCLKIRQQKFGVINWQNTLTHIKMINLFYMANNLRPKLMNYAESLQKNYYRYKNYPFQWKISLARYYLNKQCEYHKAKDTIQLLQYALIAMQKIGFAEQYFYLQYELIYELQYKEFFIKHQAYLINKPKIQKKSRKIQSPFKIREIKERKQGKSIIQSQKPKETIIINSINQKKQIKQYAQFDFSQNQLIYSKIPQKRPIRSSRIKEQKSVSFKKIESDLALPQLNFKKKQSKIVLENKSMMNNYFPQKSQSGISKYNSTIYSSKNSKNSSNNYHSNKGSRFLSKQSSYIGHRANSSFLTDKKKSQIKNPQENKNTEKSQVKV